MAQGIQTRVSLIDNVSSPIQNIINNVNNLMGSFNQLSQNGSLQTSATSAQDLNNSITQATSAIQQTAAAVQQLNTTLTQTGSNTNQNTNQQRQHNRQMRDGANAASGLLGKIKGMVAAYAGFKAVGNVINLSDELTSSQARINSMNDGLQTTAELQNEIMKSANAARGAYGDFAGVVASLGNNAGVGEGGAFANSEEVVAFTELIQKQMTIAGASTQQASNAMFQLTQAMGSGTLRGEELNSILDAAPNIIQTIADYLGVTKGEIRELAAEGQITSDVVKAAILGSADEINTAFEAMPTTFGQTMTTMKNNAIAAFEPILTKISAIVASSGFQSFVSGLTNGFVIIGNMLLWIFDLVGMVGTFFAENWSIISPIIWGIIAALGVYGAYLAITKGIELASAIAAGAMAVAKGIQAVAIWATTSATWAATTAQLGLNGAMYACPIVWIIMLIIALIAVIFAICSAIAKFTGIATSGFGVICGGVNVVIQFFKNLGLLVANIALGIGNAIAAVANNILAAFWNAICSVQSFFWGLLETVMDVITGIVKQLNKLPFIDIDTSGLTEKADEYAAKKAEAEGSKMEYKNIGDAFNEGFSTFDTFQDGWVSDAFSSGAEWGDGVADGVSSMLDGFTDTNSIYEDAMNSANNASSLGNIADNGAATAANTAQIADNTAASEEDLKYLKDIAERDTINRFTTAEIKIDMKNNNTISSDMDIDGVVAALENKLSEALMTSAEAAAVY